MFEGRRLVRAKNSDIGSPIHQLPPNTLPLHYFLDTDSEPFSPHMTEIPQYDPIAKLTAMLEALPSKFPQKFSATDLPRFKPTDDPRFHLKGFRATMSLKGIDPILYPKVFPLSLDPVCQKWFFSLDDKDIATWEDTAHVFMTQYKGNAQVSTLLRELEILRQEEKEGKVPRIKWENNGHKNDASISSKGVSNTNINTVEATRARWGEYTPLGITYTQALERLKSKGLITLLGPAPDPPLHKRHPKWDAGKYCKYHQAKGHNTEGCFALKNIIQDMLEDGRLAIGVRSPTHKTIHFVHS
ncbi:Polyamine aminopropyltransferase [Bienertia sinuspersici]